MNEVRELRRNNFNERLPVLLITFVYIYIMNTLINYYEVPIREDVFNIIFITPILLVWISISLTLAVSKHLREEQQDMKKALNYTRWQRRINTVQVIYIAVVIITGIVLQQAGIITQK